MTATTLTLAPNGLRKLQQTAKRYNTRAAKLGQPAVTLTINDDFTKVVDTGMRNAFLEPIMTEVTYTTVTFEGETPRVEGGWAFVARLETEEGGTIIASVAGSEDLPERFRDTDHSCDHCNKNRRRAAVYVVRSEAGEFKQVGRSCLQDFLDTTDAIALAKLSDGFRAMADYDEGENEWDAPTWRAKAYDNLMTALTTAAYVIRAEGWAPSSSDGPTTSMMVNQLMHPWTKEQAEANAEFTTKHGPVSDTDKATAEAARDWAAGAVCSNDYMSNLSVIAKSEYFQPKYMGFVVSMIATHTKAVAREAEWKTRDAAAVILNEQSVHVGTVGQREEFSLTVESTRSMQSAYSDNAVLYRMRDADGNLIIWFASNSIDKAAGEQVTLKATVKAHTEYNGTDQTQLTRCKVI